MTFFANKSIASTALFLPLVLPLAFNVPIATAAMITEWGYNVDNNFTDVVGTGTTGPAVAGEGTSKLLWGSSSQSSLSITANLNAEGGLVTNGTAVAGGAFIHTNRPIPENDIALSSFNLNSSLTLFSAAPGEMAGIQVGPDTVTFSSFFTETPNRAGTCTLDSASICDDIFSLANAAAGQFNAAGNFELTGDAFTIDDYSYTVYLEVLGLELLTDKECLRANSRVGCIGFLTQESTQSTFNTRFRIEASAIPVPEPDTLALMVLALMGLGLARLKQKS